MQRLVAAAQSAAHAGVRDEVVELIPALRAFARTFHRDPVDVDDLVQETLTRALANLDRFQPGTRLKSWLFTIMRNTFYTRIRISNRERPGLGHCATPSATVEATQDWTLRGQELANALNRLPPSYREALILTTVLGESYLSTAEICNCAVGTVKSRVNRARQLLAIELGETT
jgi:RNA polymerase sigma-70 factor (ECF subfamily)